MPYWWLAESEPLGFDAEDLAEHVPWGVYEQIEGREGFVYFECTPTSPTIPTSDRPGPRHLDPLLKRSTRDPPGASGR